MVNRFFANETGCASAKYVRVNGLTRPTASTRLAHNPARSDDGAGGLALAASLMAAGAGAGVGCGVAAVAGELALVGAGAGLIGEEIGAVVTRAPAEAEVGSAGSPSRRSSSCLRTESILTALRASMAL